MGIFLLCSLKSVKIVMNICSAKVFEAQEKRSPKDKDDDVVSIHTDKVEMEKANVSRVLT